MKMRDMCIKFCTMQCDEFHGIIMASIERKRMTKRGLIVADRSTKVHAKWGAKIVVRPK